MTEQSGILAGIIQTGYRITSAVERSAERLIRCADGSPFCPCHVDIIHQNRAVFPAADVLRKPQHMQFREQFILTLAVQFWNAAFSTHLAFIVITDVMRLVGFVAVIGVAYAGGSLVDCFTAELGVILRIDGLEPYRFIQTVV